MKKLLFVTFSILALSYNTATARGIADSDGYRLASFISNFHKNIATPKGKICLYGYDDVIATLQDKMPDQVVVIDDVKNKAIGQKCNLAYIGSNKEKYMSSAIKDFGEYGVSTIGYLDGFLEKSGTFLLQEGRRGSIELTLNHKMVKTLAIKLNPLIFNIINN
jgi:hypothetical protein